MDQVPVKIGTNGQMSVAMRDVMRTEQFSRDLAAIKRIKQGSKMDELTLDELGEVGGGGNGMMEP